MSSFSTSPSFTLSFSSIYFWSRPNLITILATTTLFIIIFFLHNKIDNLVLLILGNIIHDNLKIGDVLNKQPLCFLLDDPAQDQVHDEHNKHIDENFQPTIIRFYNAVYAKIWDHT